MISTKAGRVLDPEPGFDFSYDGIMRSFEQSLKRLGLDRADMLLLHDIGRFSQKDNHEAAMEQVLGGGGIRALEELRSEGAVRAVGVGVNEWQVLDELMDHAAFDVFLLANRYTLLDQEVLGHFLPRVEREGVAVIVGAPLNSGILLTGAVPGARYDYAPAPGSVLERTRAIEAVCRRHGVPLIRAALSFPLAHPAVTALLPGMATVGELTQNLAHLRAEIPDAFWTELRESGLIHPEAPVPFTPMLLTHA